MVSNPWTHVPQTWLQDGTSITSMNKYFLITLQSFWPAQPNALLVWLKENEPQNYERIGAVLMVKDYIKYRLTGEITGDYTDMSGANLMDVRKKSYSHELMALYNLSDVYDALPPLKSQQ